MVSASIAGVVDIPQDTFAAEGLCGIAVPGGADRRPSPWRCLWQLLLDGPVVLLDHRLVGREEHPEGQSPLYRLRATHGLKNPFQRLSVSTAIFSRSNSIVPEKVLCYI